VGRHRARRHVLQRRQELPVGGRRAGLRPRADRRSPRAGRRRPHHVAPPAPADQPVAGDAVGQAQLLRSGLGRHTARPARQRLGLQRRAREPARARAAPPLAAPAARRPARRVDGPDRRFEQLALARLPQLLRDDRREAHAVGQRRRPLGRRPVGEHARPRALRPPVPAPRPPRRPPGPQRALDRPLPHPVASTTRATATCGGSATAPSTPRAAAATASSSTRRATSSSSPAGSTTPTP
jgi:hypothetical protein